MLNSFPHRGFTGGCWQHSHRNFGREHNLPGFIWNRNSILRQCLFDLSNQRAIDSRSGVRALVEPVEAANVDGGCAERLHQNGWAWIFLDGIVAGQHFHDQILRALGRIAESNSNSKVQSPQRSRCEVRDLAFINRRVWNLDLVTFKGCQNRCPRRHLAHVAGCAVNFDQVTDAKWMT